MAQRGLGLSVADIVDSANFYGSSGSSEKDADNEPAAAAATAATAAGQFLYFSSAVVHIPGAILKISASCELVQAYN